MPDQKKSPANDPGAPQSPAVSERLAQFERRQGELWRLTFLLLLVISVVFAVVSWDTIRSFALHFEALPVGLVILIALFGMYTWKRSQEMSELRGLVKGLEQRNIQSTEDREFDKLFAVIERSQQGYRDLIDSFDDVLLALTLEGEVRAVNRSFADLVGLAWTHAHHADQYARVLAWFDEARSDETPRGFHDTRHWLALAHQSDAFADTAASPFDQAAAMWQRGLLDD